MVSSVSNPQSRQPKVGSILPKKTTSHIDDNLEYQIGGICIGGTICWWSETWCAIHIGFGTDQIKY